MDRGKFIVFEGCEGLGKTTQVKHLSAYLESIGIDHIVTREPGGTPTAELIRSLLLAGTFKQAGPAVETFMFAAARRHHVDVVIRPKLDQGIWVICDRYTDSTYAYQGASGVDSDTLYDLKTAAILDTKPDLTFLLDADPAVGLTRAAERRGESTPDRFEDEKLDYHQTVRNRFLFVASSEMHTYIVKADRPIDDVAYMIQKTLIQRFNIQGT
jgi:dTMP kinase